MENRDFDRAEKLKYHLLAIQRAEPAGETPAVTPYPAGATPKPENDVYRNGIADSTEDGSWVVRDVNNNEVKIPASISIDKLASMITSEDNQHFQEKQEEEQKKLREKLWWLYDGKDPDKEKKLMLFDKEELQMLEDESVRAHWPHRSQNGLMFTPSLEDSCSEYGLKLLKDKEPSRKLAVVPQNTRLRPAAVSEDMPPPPVPPPPPLQQIIATPVPEPGVGMMPAMTWGDIESTPLSLGTAVAPLDAPMTPLPKPTKREVLAEKVYRNMKKAHGPSLPVGKGEVLWVRVSGMRRRSGGMSPAAQKLQQRLKGRVSSMDTMLRKSYTPMSARPSILGGTTPGMTPGMKKKVGFVSTPAGVRTDKRVVMKGKSVTDNLLCCCLWNKPCQTTPTIFLSVA